MFSAGREVILFRNDGRAALLKRSPLVVHVTTTDISLALLLGPQLQAFKEAGFEVIGASAPGPYVAELESRGVRHVGIRHATRSMAPRRDARAFLELRSLFRTRRPDIVHTHNPKPGFYGRLAARSSAVPGIVNTVHGLYAQPGDPWARRTLVYGMERLAASVSHAELVQNPEDLETLAELGVPRTKLHLLGNGIDLDRFGPRPPRTASAPVAKLRAEMGATSPDDIVVGLVGRLVWEKGYREVFAAATNLRHRLPHVRVAIIGPRDPDKSDAVPIAETERVARQAGVRFLGLRRDVEDLYAAMDLYVLASHREGFPRSAMEAAATGLPIVATDIRGCRQVVDHGVTGLLVPVRSASALTTAVAALAEDSGRRKTMGLAAADKARREFDQRRIIALTLDVYDRVLGRSHHRIAA